MLQELYDIGFFIVMGFAFAAVHMIHGWRGTAIAFAPVALMFALAGADAMGWLNLMEPYHMLRAACWWFGLGCAGTIGAVILMKAERSKRDQRR